MNILVIEDDEFVREGLEDLLTDEGYVVKGSHDGTLGLILLGTGYRPDLVCVDLMMPTMNGYEFVKQLRRIPQHAITPVIILSGSPAMTPITVNVHVLRKPVDADVLLDRIRSLLG